MVASMRPGTGRLGVVMPHGVLFRGGDRGTHPAVSHRSDQLEAVVGLPVNLFYSTSIPACLLIFRANNRVQRRGTVWLWMARVRLHQGPEPEPDERG